MRTQLALFAFVIATYCPGAPAQWVPTNLSFTGCVSALVESRGDLFAGTNSGVFLSTDGGAWWKPVNSGLSNNVVRTLAVSGESLFAGTNAGVFLSTDAGSNWHEVNTGLPDSVWYPAIGALAFTGTNLFAGTMSSGVFLSTDAGLHWAAVNTGLTTQVIWALEVQGTRIFAGCWDGRVFCSTNNGIGWAEVDSGLPRSGVASLQVSGSNLFAGTLGDGIFRSTNQGITWHAVNSGLTNSYVWDFATLGTSLFAGTYGGVFLSTNSGTSWARASSGMGHFAVRSLVVRGTSLFAGTEDDNIWRRPIAEMITDLRTEKPVPIQLVMGQNYPNPFNPSTTIRFELPASSMVRLTVYDMLGREVSVLVNERREAGIHEATFDGGTLSSGMYVYRLRAGDFVSTKRMTLMK